MNDLYNIATYAKTPRELHTIVSNIISESLLKRKAYFFLWFMST